MIKIIQEKNNSLMLKAAYQGMEFPKYVGTKKFYLTNNLQTNESYVYIEKENINLDDLKSWFINFAKDLDMDYQIDLNSFAQKFKKEELIRFFILNAYFARTELFKKTIKEKENKINNLYLLVNENDIQTKELINKVELIAKAIAKVRNLQIMPENFLNSEQLASEITNDFSGIKNLEIQVLTKKEIQDLNMGLLLSVNKGSTHEPRVVIVKYFGNPESKEITSIVGKGITFDTGGVNTKGYHMEGMKFDMSGSVISAYTVKVLAELQAKVNAYAIMCITDNRINNDASLPENVYQSMSGKWVEVTDTDAEGRLVLADGIYYAASKLNSTTIIDVATLTGAISVALGTVYSGVWSTNETKWQKFKEASLKAQEKVWRMPFHKDFDKGNKSSKVADLANWSSIVKSDSNQAALFLKEFTNDIDFIHCDVAGTAEIKGQPMGVLVSTLVEYILNS
ncbi:leucyl aminopeptidase family protein [Mycoplasmopsis felis]|uniref:M17 family metallopeptidase n=1 Tax=Mycoplasmopsis felis TaxID=33923 RepID=UPI002AFEA70E|nr:leucyl aminopeptidase family protein [Mycoplasmopsis felis]WQQ10996.1 leucyl aminopeptidase family protein [Mycoplasmopsis felis]